MFSLLTSIYFYSTISQHKLAVKRHVIVEGQGQPRITSTLDITKEKKCDNFNNLQSERNNLWAWASLFAPFPRSVADFVLTFFFTLIPAMSYKFFYIVANSKLSFSWQLPTVKLVVRSLTILSWRRFQVKFFKCEQNWNKIKGKKENLHKKNSSFPCLFFSQNLIKSLRFTKSNPHLLLILLSLGS